MQQSIEPVRVVRHTESLRLGSSVVQYTPLKLQSLPLPWSLRQHRDVCQIRLPGLDPATNSGVMRGKDSPIDLRDVTVNSEVIVTHLQLLWLQGINE